MGDFQIGLLCGGPLAAGLILLGLWFRQAATGDNRVLRQLRQAGIKTEADVTSSRAVPRSGKVPATYYVSYSYRISTDQPGRDAVYDHEVSVSYEDYLKLHDQKQIMIYHLPDQRDTARLAGDVDRGPEPEARGFHLLGWFFIGAGALLVVLVLLSLPNTFQP